MRAFAIKGLFLFALIFTFFIPANANAQTSFERVIKTNTIRCSYSVWYPEMIMDPNTKVLSGYAYDVMEAIGKVLGLKIEWVEEVGPGVAHQGLATNRYDVACNGFWGPPGRTKTAFFSTPFAFFPLFAVTRSDLKGPSDNFEWLNSEKYKLAVFRGTVEDIILSTNFPKAQSFDAMELSTDGNILMDLINGKTDFAISNYTAVERFQKDNPGSKVSIIKKPIMTAPAAFLIANDDFRLKHMIDTTIAHLIDSGEIGRIMSKYMTKEGVEWINPPSQTGK